MRHSNPATTEIYLHNDTDRAEADIAQQLYRSYHGQSSTDTRDKLNRIAATLTPQQLEQLTALAQTMNH